MTQLLAEIIHDADPNTTIQETLHEPSHNEQSIHDYKYHCALNVKV